MKDTASFLRHGFTLIELLVVMGVIFLLSAGAIANYNGFDDNQKLKQAALTLKNTVRASQSRALAGEKPTSGCTQLVGFEIGFSATSYSLQARCSEGLAGEATTVNFPKGVTFSQVPASIVFQVLTGRTDKTSDISLILLGMAKRYTLLLHPNGDIEDSGFGAL